jgi:hypothetical protein|tara:strand:- start:338 stop:625 length:288 start_codon:yes stop_codon:yes gene_type:complete
MKCWHCSEELIWGGDHESEDDGFVMDTNLSCPGCESIVMVSLPENKDKDYMHVLTVQAGEVVRPEGDSGLAELKKVLNDNGIRASLSIKIREGQG